MKIKSCKLINNLQYSTSKKKKHNKDFPSVILIYLETVT